MTKRLPVRPAPGPLEGYAARFDGLFHTRAQREGFRRYLEGLLLPAERSKTLTALANTEPVAGAQRKEAQYLQWFLSESGWNPQEVNERRLELLLEDPATAQNGEGVLVIDVRRAFRRNRSTRNCSYRESYTRHAGGLPRRLLIWRREPDADGR